MKGGKDQIYKKRCCSVFWDLADDVQSIIFCSQIMTERIDAMSFIGRLSPQNHIKNEFIAIPSINIAQAYLKRIRYRNHHCVFTTRTLQFFDMYTFLNSI